VQNVPASWVETAIVAALHTTWFIYNLRAATLHATSGKFASNVRLTSEWQSQLLSIPNKLKVVDDAFHHRKHC